MNTKSQIKTRNSRYMKGNNEVIEISEPSNYKSKVYQKRKDLIENISSEATTPNKKGIKKKKMDNELIEIIDNKENVGRKNKKVVKREIKGKEKGKNKSADKVKKNVNNKKEKKVMSITLEESDNEEEELKEESPVNRPSKRNVKQQQVRKYASKTPDKRNKKKMYLPQKNNKKKAKRKKENKITQYEISSSEEENQEEAEDTQEKIDSGYFSSRKASQIKKMNDNEQEDQKSKSTIKSGFLGKKRKNERNVKSRTPSKLNKNEIHVLNKTPIEIKNSPIKMRAGKSSKTPVKNYSKKIKNMFPVDSGVNSLDSKNYVTPELAVLNQLIVEFGFEKVLDSLCKAKLNHKNKLDSCVQGLRDSCANEKLPLFLIKMLFSYFENKEKEKEPKEKSPVKLPEPEEPKVQEKEKEKEKENKKSSVSMLKSSSTENTNTNNEANESSEKPVSKSPTKLNQPNLTNIPPMIIEEQITSPIHLTDEETANTPSVKKEKKVSQMEIQEMKKIIEKSPIKSQKEEGKKEKKNMSIGSHYHKDEDGLIYKYQVYKLDGQGNAIFKCYDDKCVSEGIYDLDSRIFAVNVKHSLKHQEHDYIINYDKSEDNVFKEMSNLNKNDAQVFKEGNERTVKIY